MRSVHESEITLASDGAELPECKALCFRPDGQGWTAIYSPSLTAYQFADNRRGDMSLASLRSAGTRYDPEQICEALHDMQDKPFGGRLGTTGATGT